MRIRRVVDDLSLLYGLVMAVGGGDDCEYKVLDPTKQLPSDQVTLVGLTHSLSDQHFRIGGRLYQPGALDRSNGVNFSSSHIQRHGRVPLNPPNMPSYIQTYATISLVAMGRSGYNGHLP